MKASELQELKVIPTGLPDVDSLLGGGLYVRRISQLSGRYSVGKSTLAALVVIQAQRMGYDACWLDVEGRFALKYFERLGVDMKKLELQQGLCAEDYFDFTQRWVEKHEGIIILDSVAALLTRNESEKENGPSIPEVPKMIPNFLKRMNNTLVKRDCAFIILNHEKIDFDGALKVIGGRSVEHLVTQWVRLRKMTMKPIKKGANQIGDTIEASMKKDENQYKKVEIELYPNEGFRGFVPVGDQVQPKEKKRGRPKLQTKDNII